MKRRYCLSVLLLYLCQFAFAGSDFTGRWIYDASMSTLPYTGDRIIVHTGATLRITREWDSRTSSLEYILDGLEHTYVARINSSMRYRAVLNGNTLRITGTVNSQARGSLDYPIDRTYILSNDNKTLTHITTIHTLKGPIVHKEVYKKR